jgi:hypothetical protein
MFTKRRVAITSLLLPLLLYAAFLTTSLYQRSQLDKTIQEADGLIWGKGNDQHVVHVETKKPTVEQIHYEIRIERLNDKKIVYSDSFEIDFDMYGGGFFSSMQVDNDPELELVAWGIHEQKRSFFLDFSNDAVAKKSLDHISPEANKLIDQWRKYNIERPVELLIVVVFLLGYYILYGLIWGTRRIYRLFRPVNASKTK